MEKFTFAQFLTGWSQPAKDHKVSDNDFKNVRTAFKNYVFPAIGVCSNDLASKGFGDVCDKLTLKQFVEACVRCYDKELAQNPHLSETLPHPKENLHGFVLFFFDRDFDARIAAGAVSQESKRNYRPPLGRSLQWLVKQWWWQEMFPENMPEIAPVRTNRPKKPITKPRGESYTLKREELPESLIQQLNEYRAVRLDGAAALWKQIQQKTRKANRSRLEDRSQRQPRQPRPEFGPIAESTYQTQETLFRGFWGWLVNIEGYDPSKLNLEMLLNVPLLEDYGYWQVEDYGITHGSLVGLVAGVIGLAKVLNFDKTKRGNWSDIPVIGELQDLRREYKKAYKQEHKANLKSRWATQLITHAELQQLLPYLKERCAPYTAKISKLTKKIVKGVKQSDAQILRKYQAYLLVKYFIYLPNRKQEPQQYVIDETLFRELDKQGEYRYFARNIRHKNQRHTGKRDYPLPKILTRDLDEWEQKYRPKAIAALQSLEAWLAFWGYELDDLQKLRKRLDSAHQGIMPAFVKDEQKYIRRLEEQLRALQNRIDSYSIAKANFEEHNSFFFTIALAKPTEFGQPLSSNTIWDMVQSSVSVASQVVLGKPVWTPPHAFRHISEKLVRDNKGDKRKMGKLINHDEAMGDEYAKQITEEAEELEEIVDTWCEKM